MEDDKEAQAELDRLAQFGKEAMDAISARDRDAHAFARIGGELKAKHRHVRWHRTVLGPAFYRRPTKHEFLSWQQHKDGTLKAQAFDMLIEECFLGIIEAGVLVHEKDTFERLIDAEGFGYQSTGRGSAGTLILQLAGAVENREGGPI